MGEEDRADCREGSCLEPGEVHRRVKRRYKNKTSCRSPIPFHNALLPPSLA